LTAYFRLDFECQPKARYGAPMLYQLSLLEGRVNEIKAQLGQLNASQQHDLQLVDSERGSALPVINLAEAERALMPLRSVAATCLKCPANFALQEGENRAAGCWSSISYPIDDISEQLLGLTVERLASEDRDSNAHYFLDIIAADERKYTGLSIATLRNKRSHDALAVPRTSTRILGTGNQFGIFFECPIEPFKIAYNYLGREVLIGANKVWQLLFSSRIAPEVVPTHLLFVSAWLNEGVRTMNNPATERELREQISNSRTMNSLLRLRKMLALTVSLGIGLSVEY
jgi:hypothetical protein